MERVLERVLVPTVTSAQPRMNIEFPRMLLYFLCGLGVTGLLYKLQYDNTNIFKLLFQINSLSSRDVEQILHGMDEDLTVEDICSLLIKIYNLQESKLLESQRLNPSTYILTIYYRLGVIDKKTLEQIESLVKVPLALRRCKNIIKQLNENGSTMLLMLLPKLAQTTNDTMTKLHFMHIIPHILYDSLRYDLYDFIDNQQREAKGGDDRSANNSSINSEDSITASLVSYYQQDDEPVSNTTTQSSGTTDVVYPERRVSHNYGDSTGTVNNNTNYGSYTSPSRQIRKPRQSDVYDYLERL